MDRSYQTSPQPYQFYGLQREHSSVSRATTQSPKLRMGISNLNQNAVYGTVQQSSDEYLNFDEFDELELFPSSAMGSSRNSMSSSYDVNWMPSGFQSSSMPDITSSSRRGSNEKEGNLTPAQSRRRSQNRAAQRAFRERKERRIKELEARIADLEEQSQSIGGENTRLKKEIAHLKTNNNMLRATSDHDDLDHYVEYSSWRSKQQLK